MTMEGNTLKKGGFKTRVENAMKMATTSSGSEPGGGEQMGEHKE